MTPQCSLGAAIDMATPGPQPVWEHVWRHSPSAVDDDRVLARERCGRRWALVRERLEAAFGSIRGLRTIELGSGRGDMSVLLAECGAEVTLLDASVAALTQAGQRFDRLGLGARLIHGDLFAGAELCGGSFDVSLSLGVIEHFRGDRRTAAIRAHRKMLKPGGMTIISVPHARCVPYRLWKVHLELRRRFPYGLEIPYSTGELARRAGRARLQQIETCRLAFLQSVGVHWFKPLCGRRPRWADEPSRLDDLMGLVLLMFGRRDGRWFPG